jgi:CHAT domain
LAKELGDLLSQYQSLQGRIRASSPRFAALTQPQPVTAAEIQTECLDSNTVLLEIALGDERSWLWAITPDAINSYALPPRAEVEASARNVYELLTARQPKKDLTEAKRLKRIAEADAKLRAEAATLGRMLLGPISAQLRQEWKGRRLAVVASGALEYVPFAVLPAPETERRKDGETEGQRDRGMERQGDKETGKQGDKENPQSAIRNPQSAIPIPLIASHEVVYLPSASALAALRWETAGRQPAAKTLAVIADPVFEPNDPRVLAAAQKKRSNDNLGANVQSKGEAPADISSTTNSALRRATKSVNRAGFSRLPFSREEADSIAELIPKSSLFKATDFQANRTSATSGQLSRYRIIHFATHGLLNSEHPELSGLVLSLVDENGKTQDGFLRMDEIFNLQLPADLVVLSACQTALGKEIKGEGLVGLTRGFMYAGAERVVASLWQVEDQATAQLMRYFYRGMLKENLRPSAALRAAQIEMSKSSRWSSPYYWAGFVMQGEWR